MARYPTIQYVSLYTAGSVARKLEVDAPVRKMPRAKTRKHSKITLYVDPVAFLGIATAVIMLVVMSVSYFRLRGVQQEAAAMSSYVQQLRAENKALRAEYEAGFDVEEIDYTAHALGMVSKDQVRHVTLSVQSQEVPQNVTVWQRMCTFLAGLFA